MFASLKSAVSAAATSLTALTQQPMWQRQPPVQIGHRTIQIKEQLGEGGFAYVYSVEDVSTGESFAMKRMLCQDLEARNIAEKEIRMLKLLKGHTNIIQMVGSCQRENTQSSHRAMEYFILLELCTGGSLIDLIKRQNGEKLDELEICQYFIQICKGVSQMHTQSPPIAHRDLKIENVLINERGELKLCDFGSCCTTSKAYTTQKEIVEEEEIISKYSTQMYRAPEMVDLYKRLVVNEKVDIWALGGILYTLAFYTQPFQDGGNLQIMSGSYQLPDDHGFSKYLTALIKRLLTVDPVARPDIRQVLNLCEQWRTWLTGGKTKAQIPTKTPAPTSITTSSASSSSSRRSAAPPQPHSAKPSSSSSSAIAPSSSTSSSAVKKKRPPKHADSAPAPIVTSAAADDWADFSSAPALTPMAPSDNESSSSSSSDDSSSSDEDDTKQHRTKSSTRTKTAAPTTATSSKSTTANVRPASTASNTASLFDLSSFEIPSSLSSSTPLPSNKSTSSHRNNNWASFDHPNSTSSFGHDDWASFESASSSSSSSHVPTTSNRVSASPSSASSSSVSMNQHGFDFSMDFSSLNPIPPHTPTTPKMMKTASSSNLHSSSPTPNTLTQSSRKQRHGDKSVEQIDITKLSISRQASFNNNHNHNSNEEDEGRNRFKITLGKSNR